MERYSLQFLGTCDWALLAFLLATVTLLLLACGAWQLHRRRWQLR